MKTVTGSYRWLYIPTMFPHTWVYFFFRRDRRSPGRSWTVRDYSSGTMVEYKAQDYADLTHDDIIQLTEKQTKAPNNVGIHDPYWVTETRELNQTLTSGGAERTTARHRSPGRPSASSAVSPGGRFNFPMLDVGELLKLPKAQKGQDMRRICESANSEDYVTWNALRLLNRIDGWWSAVLRLADVEHSMLDVDDVPVIHFWRTVPSPPEYETAQREQMRESKVEKFVERSGNLRSVEGLTEVDAVFEGNDFLIYLEAKLSSDLSARTTYDPTRNQLARNIDCCIEQAGGRLPLVWMLTKDRRSDRLYTQLVESYCEDPSQLHQLLPHRPKEQVEGICGRLRIILWADLMRLIASLAKSEPAIVQELQRRVES